MIEISVITNKHTNFYQIVGPLLAQRSIAKELGMGTTLDGVIWDDENKLWFIAMDGDEVAGFATLLPTSQKILFPEAYVLPNYRNQGVHARLIDERLAHCPVGSTIQVLVGESSINQYRARGFTVKRERGKSFTEMVKKVEEKEDE